VLVRLLEQDPRLVRELAYGEAVSFAQLARDLQREESLSALIRDVQDEPLATERLDNSYLAVLEASEWARSFDLALADEEVEAPEWVTCIGGDGDLGVMLPNHSSDVRRLSLHGCRGFDPPCWARPISQQPLGRVAQRRHRPLRLPATQARLWSVILVRAEDVSCEDE
jgi:hypothetical protein